MKHLLITLILLLFSSLQTKSQTAYSARIETGYQHYLSRILTVEPGPEWKGYNLDNRQNGFNLNFINGFKFLDKKLFTGIGLGYQNFQNINGISAFGDIEYVTLKSKLSPLLNLKIGYNHIWNQYEGGTGTAYTEFVLGIDYKINHKNGIYIKSGILITQQSFFIPMTFGFRY